MRFYRKKLKEKNMRKIIAVILTAVLLSLPFTATAHSDHINLGSVPKTAVAPTIDGVKDDIYNQGLMIPIRNPHSATPDGGLGGGADAWLLWEDNYLYVYATVNVAGFYHPDNYDTLQTTEAWVLTTLEILLDYTNAATLPDEVSQYRINDSGFPNVTLGRNSAVVNGADCKPIMETGSTKTDTSYSAEFKINFSESKTQGTANGIPSFGGDFTAGKQIGIYLFSQEVAADNSSQALYIAGPTDRSGNWEPSLYDYIVLGDTVVGAPAVEEPAAETPAAADTPAPEQTTATPAPQTGDYTMILVILAIASAAVIAVFRKKSAVK
jgi:hypothetical protein